MDRLALLMQALNYYGLPSNYQRIFTKNGGRGLKSITVSDAASQPIYAWIQLNEVDSQHPITKPSNKDITCVRNISIDIDYPQDPTVAHTVASKLASHISDHFVHPPIPIEDSGGGAHLVIPIPGIDTNLYGGGDVVNTAVSLTVNELLKPIFLSICADEGVNEKDIDFGSFDISRIFSSPGTYRPPHPTKPDATFLRNGYIRRWVIEYNDDDLERITCQALQDAILDRIATPANGTNTSGAQAQSVSSSGSGSSSNHDPAFEKWLRQWASRNQNTTGNRSDYFYRIVCAAYRRSNGVETVVIDHADVIDDLAGSKYGNRAAFEVQRCLSRAKTMPRSRGTVLGIQDYVDAFEQLGYEFRLNLCGGDIEVNGERMTDYLDSRVMNQMYDLGFSNEARIRNVWRDLADQHSYHPVKEYLGQCFLDWDGTSRIDGLVGCFTVDEEKLEHILSNNSFGFDKGHDIAVAWFRRWMIGAVAKVMDLAQNSVLVLEGAQDIGKSYMVRWLCRDLPEYHIEQAVNLSRSENDTNIRATRKWIWEIGELGATTRKESEDALKAFFTRQFVTVRKPYGRNDMELPMLSSFIGTVNDSGRGVFGDPTGNRRFATLPIRAIDHTYSSRFDTKQIWGEACAAYAAGERWRMDKTESAVRDAINEIYNTPDPMVEILPRYFHINGSKNRMTGSEIALYLKRYGVLRDADKSQTTQIGIAMKKLGVRKLRDSRGWVFEGVDLKSPEERAMDHI